MEPIPGGNLEALVDALGDPLFQIVAHLAKGPIGQQAAPVSLATLVEADFPGYAPITLVADLENATEQEGYGELSPQRLEWTAGLVVVPQRITHVYYTYKYGDNAHSLQSVVAFDNPLTIDTPGQIINLEATVVCVETL